MGLSNSPAWLCFLGPCRGGDGATKGLECVQRTLVIRGRSDHGDNAARGEGALGLDASALETSRGYSHSKHCLTFKSGGSPQVSRSLARIFSQPWGPSL